MAWLVEFDPAPAMIADAAAGDLDGGAHDAVLLGRRQRRGFAGGFADHDGRDARGDLAFAKSCECRQIKIAPLHRRAWEDRGCSPPARWRDEAFLSSAFTLPLPSG